jgi:hypothetical protein
LSDTTCNEFIEIKVDKLRDQFIKEVKQVTYFPLIVYSIPKVSHVDTFSLFSNMCFQMVKSKKYLSFIDIYAHTTAESLEHVSLQTQKTGHWH